MSKTELLNPIAKYYIIDSQFGYKQNVSLEQNYIQSLKKIFSRGEPDVLCPASGAGEGDSPLAPLSPQPSLSSCPLCSASRMVLRGCLCCTAGFWVVPAAQGRYLASLASASCSSCTSHCCWLLCAAATCLVALM